jgi:dihydrodipicolinate synthase/N-acetylneuraminate lyase
VAREGTSRVPREERAPGPGAASWEGIWGFPLTPFGPRGIDFDQLAEGAACQLHGGVDVLCACGVIAQVERLDREEHRACVQAIARVAAGRVPVVATLLAGRDAPRIAAAAVEAGAGGLVVIPRSPRVDAAERTLRAVASAAPGVPLAL